MKQKSCSIALFTAAAGLLLSCFACQGPDRRQPATPPEALNTSRGETLRLGAWNIEWLGVPDRRSGPATSHAQTPEALAEYIMAADLDLLALEELDDTLIVDGEPRNKTVARALEIVNRRTGENWTHRLTRSRYEYHHLGVAWNQDRLAYVAGPIEICRPEGDSSQGKTRWSRPPYAHVFSAGAGLTDFVVIPVHQKSNYGGDFSVHRGEEAAVFCTALPQRITDPDVVIIGDTNAATTDEPAIREYVAAGWVDLNAEDKSTHWRREYGGLDRILVPLDQPEFTREFIVLREDFLRPRELSEEDFKIGYSDHFMVITEMRVLPDDD